MANPLRLWYLLEGVRAENYGRVELSSDLEVLDLKQAIDAEDRRFLEANGIDARDLSIWKLNDHVAFNPRKTLIERIESTITEDQEPLPADDLLSTLWPEQPPRGIHIWVTLRRPPVLPAIQSSNSRSLVPVSEDEETYRRLNIIERAKKRRSPSTDARNSNLMSIQNVARDDALYNGRPYSLAPPPIAIYDPVFAYFSRELSAVPNIGDFSKEELEQTRNFITLSLDFYQDEKRRQLALESVVAQLLGGRMASLQSTDIILGSNTIVPDGHHSCACPALSMGGRPIFTEIFIDKLKNGPGDGGCDPVAQAECCYVSMCSSDKFKPVLEACCFPVFLIGILGPYISVGGAVFADRLISQRLTDYEYVGSTDCTADTDERILRLAHLFRTLKKALDRLEHFYATLTPPPPALLKSKERLGTSKASVNSKMIDSSTLTLTAVPPFFGPHFQTFTKDGVQYKLKYTGRLAPETVSKPIFYATMTCNSNSDFRPQHVVVKFSKHYSKEAHDLLIKSNFAPQLWFCEKVKDVGNLWVVVMDFINVQKKKINGSKLKEAIRILHEAGIVHGDLRIPNILYTSKGPMLIDFEWSGPEGESRYPLSINKSIDWAEGTGPGQVITKEHDLAMLKLMGVV